MVGCNIEQKKQKTKMRQRLWDGCEERKKVIGQIWSKSFARKTIENIVWSDSDSVWQLSKRSDRELEEY